MRKKLIWIGAFAAVFALVHFLWYAWARWAVHAVASWSTTPEQIAALGQTGDLFGGINALFAAYAFTGVAVAAYFQYRTFNHVEEQVRLQSEQATRQAFEPLFFRLLELNRAAIPTELYSDVWRGPVDMTGAARGLTKWLSTADFYGQLQNMSCEQLTSVIEEKLYKSFYRTNEDHLGPYFRTLFRIFSLIDQSGLPPKEKIQYADIARSLLTRSELVLVMINSASERGAEFRPLIQRYRLLRNLRGEGDQIRDWSAPILEKLYPQQTNLGSQSLKRNGSPQEQLTRSQETVP